ncbi:hypothetical protein BD289DRAFT_438514 [Coniella lustricola]|uniref:rRNA methyltransferase 1, mitochondrial n=1 Tax=Coniella lustricola TaxID=2025994 RepID=A0A2T3A2T8_9PEZI|nr:hypothetical protein BD289DRAFT_438514 [Coniella lustricola]
MRLITNLPLLGRNIPIRPTVLPLVLSRSASRLSGIHDGLRRSERARPQGVTSPKREIRQSIEDEPYLTPAERLHARSIARHNRPTFKIRKGKKNITEPAGPPRKSRAARLSDPRDPLGANSQLKKFRTGQLLDEIRAGEQAQGSRDGAIQHDDFARQMLATEVEGLMNSRQVAGKRGRSRSWDVARKNSPPTRSSPSSDRFNDYRAERQSFPRQRHEQRSEFDSESGFDSTGGLSANPLAPQNNRFDDRRRPSQYSDDRRGPRVARDQDTFGQRRREREMEREEMFARPARPARSEQYDTRSRDDHRDGSRYGSRREDDAFSELTEASENAESQGTVEKKRKTMDIPVSIPYTTAASQFLYGTSTVEAALQASTRKLYKLYIYRGGNRRNQEKDDYLIKVAQQKNIEVGLLDEDGLGMMNKMSGGRPHNGYVLEASPLAQMPVKALGEVSAEESWPGFKVVRGHQSVEEASVNGTADFIITEPSQYKPLVLYVDQVLDPGNLGAIIRTASFMGVTAIAVSKRGSAPVTPVVLKASAGAAETMTMFTVDAPIDFMRESRENGWRIYAAVPPKPGSERKQVDLRHVETTDPLIKHPCVLVMGSEGEGLSRQLRRISDFEVGIPNMSGSKTIDSLNVSVATGLLCAAFVRNKSKSLDSEVEDAGALF